MNYEELTEKYKTDKKFRELVDKWNEIPNAPHGLGKYVHDNPDKIKEVLDFLKDAK